MSSPGSSLSFGSGAAREGGETATLSEQYEYEYASATNANGDEVLSNKLLPGGGDELESGSDIRHFAQRIAAHLNSERPASVGFECPFFVPLRLHGFRSWCGGAWFVLERLRTGRQGVLSDAPDDHPHVLAHTELP